MVLLHNPSRNLDAPSSRSTPHHGTLQAFKVSHDRRIPDLRMGLRLEDRQDSFQAPSNGHLSHSMVHTLRRRSYRLWDRDPVCENRAQNGHGSNCYPLHHCHIVWDCRCLLLAHHLPSLQPADESHHSLLYRTYGNYPLVRAHGLSSLHQVLGHRRVTTVLGNLSSGIRARLCHGRTILLLSIVLWTLDSTWE